MFAKFLIIAVVLTVIGLAMALPYPDAEAFADPHRRGGYGGYGGFGGHRGYGGHRGGYGGYGGGYGGYGGYGWGR